MKLLRVLGILTIVLLSVVVVALQFGPSVPTARGKSPSVPLADGLTPEQVLAQDLALADARVQQYTVGRRSEVFGVRQVLADQYTAASTACKTADCRQVEIYLFDENAAVTALVNLDTQTVLDVLYLANMQPGINKRLADRAIDIAINAPEVIDALGYKPTAEGLAAVPAGVRGTVCAHQHLCAAPTFKQNGRFLWAFVDLTDDRLLTVQWTEAGEDGSTVPFTPEGCPPPGSVTRDGWSLLHEVTGTDSMRIYDVTYNGVPVATSIKLVEWHAAYPGFGFVDATGCGGGGGGFPIYPYGNTQVLDLLDGQSNIIGFEVVQDFRMGSWGSGCNYRYEQRIQFFADGRFRTASLAYGQGCGTNATYRPLVRVDIAVNGDASDSFAYWDGSQWLTQANELYRTPYDGPNGPHASDANGHAWRITDQSGAGYYLEPSVGQFGDGSEGDAPFVYAVTHHANEGDTDLGVIGTCCNSDHTQGPHNYVNNEALENQNIVLWYIPQMVTDASPPDYYCWTLQGEPNPITYPCWSGPMFVPISQAPNAQFEYTTPVLAGLPVALINTSTGQDPVSYEWDLGDGSPIVTTEHVTQTYTSAGDFTVVLTATDSLGSDVYSAVLQVLPVVAGFSHTSEVLVAQPVTFTNESVGAEVMSYVWDFGDGTATSTDMNPTHVYTVSGNYTVTLTASNSYGSDVSTSTIQVVEAATAAFSYSGSGFVGEPINFSNESGGTPPITYNWDFGDGNNSTEENPSHTYMAAGTYTVTLTAENPYGTDTFTTTIDISQVFVPEFMVYLPITIKP